MSNTLEHHTYVRWVRGGCLSTTTPWQTLSTALGFDIGQALTLGTNLSTMLSELSLHHPVAATVLLVAIDELVSSKLIEVEVR